MTITEFKMRCRSKHFTDNTPGIFMLEKDGAVTDMHVMPSDCDVMQFPDWAKQVIWIEN